MVVTITYFVHGTTTDNEQRIATGWNHGELSELGKKQSVELPSKINEGFDAVFSSDLKRAVDSAQLSFEGKYTLVIDKRLRECNYGDWNGKKKDWNIINHIDIGYPNGESYKDVEIRIRDFLTFLKDNYEGKHIAIVAHQAPQLALDVVLRGRTWEQAIKEDWRERKAWQPGWTYLLG